MTITKLQVCYDCHTYVTGDLTPFDYHYSPEESEIKINHIEQCLTELTEKYGYVSNSDDDVCEFSSRNCECCHSYLAGERHIIIFSKTQE